MGQHKTYVKEPIAIVGIGCRFPGAPSTAAFWKLLQDGTDAIRDVPPDRWDRALLRRDLYRVSPRPDFRAS